MTDINATHCFTNLVAGNPEMPTAGSSSVPCTILQLARSPSTSMHKHAEFCCALTLLKPVSYSWALPQDIAPYLFKHCDPDVVIDIIPLANLWRKL